MDGQWPYATLADTTGAEHYGARVAQELARRLQAAMATQRLSANRLARTSGVNRQTIANVLAGSVWPDLLTIANLQRALGLEFLPDSPDRRRAWPGPIIEEEHEHLAAPGDGAGTSD